MSETAQITSQAGKAKSLLEAIRNEEYERIAAGITSLPDHTLESNLKNLALENAELSARLRIIEEYLAEMAPPQQKAIEQTASPEDEPAPAVSPGVSQYRKLDVMARDLEAWGNWYELESSETGQEFRWSGPKNRNTLKLPLRRSHSLLVKVAIVAVIDPAFLNELAVFIDGAGTEYVLFDDGETVRLQFIIPAAASAISGYTKLVLQIPSTHTPIEMASSEDYRKLGMAVASLKVRRKWPDLVEKIIERLNSSPTHPEIATRDGNGLKP